MTLDDLAEIAAVRALCASGYARRIREEAHIGQGELARTLGISEATLCRWESGERMPRPALATRYAIALRRLLHSMWGAQVETAGFFSSIGADWGIPKEIA